MRGGPYLLALFACGLLAACSAAEGGIEVRPATPTPEHQTAGVTTPDASSSSGADRSPTPANADAERIPDPLPCGDILVPIGKGHALAPDCRPHDLVALPADITDGGTHLLRREAADALVRMLAAARADGYRIYVVSAYRSYEEQVLTHQYWVSVLGEREAERTSARPGHSEHQLGTTVDLSNDTVGGQLVPEFGATPEGKWLAANAWQYGFALSYPEGQEAATGYAYEPWHWRYIGPEAAARWWDSGLTLRELLLQEWRGR